MLSHTIGCSVAESEVAELLLKVERAHEGCQIGSYPFFRDGGVGANFVIRSTDPHPLNLCATPLPVGLTAHGWPAVDGGICSPMHFSARSPRTIASRGLSITRLSVRLRKSAVGRPGRRSTANDCVAARGAKPV